MTPPPAREPAKILLTPKIGYNSNIKSPTSTLYDNHYLGEPFEIRNDSKLVKVTQEVLGLSRLHLDATG